MFFVSKYCQLKVNHQTNYYKRYRTCKLIYYPFCSFSSSVMMSRIVRVIFLIGFAILEPASTSPYFRQINITETISHTVESSTSTQISSRIITSPTDSDLINVLEQLLDIFPKERRETHTLPSDRVIVFPTELDQYETGPKYVPLRPPKCSEHETICENIDTYPYDNLNKTLSDVFRSNMQFFGVDEHPLEISNRVGDQDDDPILCGSTTRTIFPQLGLNKNNKWRYIINQGSNNDFSQGILTETCIRANSACNIIQDIPIGYISHCKQKYIYRRLLAIDENSKPVADTFQIPTACCCEFKRDYTILSNIKKSLTPTPSND